LKEVVVDVDRGIERECMVEKDGELSEAGFKKISQEGDGWRRYSIR